ncbi:MAG: patatin-like phospholipase family protein [Roseiarcus sp.]
MVSHPRRGIALAGGGPLGAIYEIGALLAIGEALEGLDLTDCDVYVGVSSGSFITAGLANGLSPRAMHEMFIESDAADDPFEPGLLLRPALDEYAGRLAGVPKLLASAAAHYLEHAGSRGFFESFGRLAGALPTGIFDNAGVGEYLTQLFSEPKRTNDFRELKHKLFLVATDVDTGESVPFGASGWDDVPIARAVQASAALPGLFPPVEIGGRFYVDGALTKTLHSSVALREGAKLLLCVNPLVPFDSRLAASRTHQKQVSIVRGGLPAIMSQTLRTLIYSRMQVGMERNRKDFPDADVVLFQPDRDDVEMFFTNVFSYSGRRRLCEHAYQRTRDDLRRRGAELRDVFARHGVTIDEKALAEPRTLLASRHVVDRRRPPDLERTAIKLDETLDLLESLLKTYAAPADERRAG